LKPLFFQIWILSPESGAKIHSKSPPITTTSAQVHPSKNPTIHPAAPPNNQDLDWRAPPMAFKEVKAVGYEFSLLKLL